VLPLVEYQKNGRAHRPSPTGTRFHISPGAAAGGVGFAASLAKEGVSSWELRNENCRGAVSAPEGKFGTGNPSPTERKTAKTP